MVLTRVSQCGAGVVTFCSQCNQDEDVLEIAKYAVTEITEDFDQSNEWALQHVAKVHQQVNISTQSDVFNIMNVRW